MLLFLLCLLISDFLYLMSSYKSYSLNDESDDDGSDSRSAGTCALPFCFDESVGCVGVYIGFVGNSIGCVCGVGSGVIVPTGIESIADVVLLVMFVPKGVESKGSQLIEIFWRPKS